MDRSVGAPTSVRIGNVIAMCARCGGSTFARKRLSRHLYTDVYICLSCERETSRAELVQQIALKVTRNAEALLDELRSARGDKHRL